MTLFTTFLAVSFGGVMGIVILMLSLSLLDVITQKYGDIWAWILVWCGIAAVFYMISYVLT